MPPRATAAAFTPDGGLILIGWADGRITARSTSGCIRELSPPRPGANQMILAIAVAPDGGRMVAAKLSGLEAFDLKAGRLTFDRPVDGNLLAREYIHISADGLFALLRSQLSGRAWLFDLTSGKVSVLTGGRDIGPSFDGNLVLTYDDQAVHIWSRDGTLSRNINAKSYIMSAGLVGNGKLLLGHAGEADIVDLETGVRSSAPRAKGFFDITELQGGALVANDLNDWYELDRTGGVKSAPHPLGGGGYGVIPFSAGIGGSCSGLPMTTCSR